MKKKIIIISSVILILLLTSIFLYLNSFKLKGKDKVELAYGENYQEEGFKAKFLFISLKSLVKVESTVDEEKVGTYEVTYHLPFKTIKREVIVKDKKEPTITLKGKDKVVISYGKKYEDEGYEAIDDYDGDLTEKVKVDSNVDYDKIGNYEISYEVKDSSNNTSKVVRKVEIKDDVAPSITLKGSSTVYVTVGKTYNDSGCTAKDNYDGDLTSKVKVTSTVNTKKTGTYTVTYEVKDSSDNKTTKKRTVIVQNAAAKSNTTSKTTTTTKAGMTYVNGILLVNKTHPIPSTYNPGVNPTANSALKKLQAGAKSAGYSMPLLSGFRSYSYQKTLYNNYVKTYGEAKANTFSAKAGQSEHQTGLAFDVGQISSNYGNTAAGKWLANNCYKYGFIIRYLKGKENITGYKYEPWHIRYVGVKAATEIHNRGITLEEYLGVLN